MLPTDLCPLLGRGEEHVPLLVSGRCEFTDISSPTADDDLPAVVDGELGHDAVDALPPVDLVEHPGARSQAVVGEEAVQLARVRYLQIMFIRTCEARRAKALFPYLIAPRKELLLRGGQNLMESVLRGEYGPRQLVDCLLGAQALPLDAVAVRLPDVVWNWRANIIPVVILCTSTYPNISKM